MLPHVSLLRDVNYLTRRATRCRANYIDDVLRLPLLLCFSSMFYDLALTLQVLAAGEAAVVVELRGVALVLLYQLGGEYGLLAVAPGALRPLDQRLREAEHEERGQEQEEAAEDETAPPGPDPARVVGRDVQRTCAEEQTQVSWCLKNR